MRDKKIIEGFIDKVMNRDLYRNVQIVAIVALVLLIAGVFTSSVLLCAVGGAVIVAASLMEYRVLDYFWAGTQANRDIIKDLRNQAMTYENKLYDRYDVETEYMARLVDDINKLVPDQKAKEALLESANELWKSIPLKYKSSTEVNDYGEI